MQELAGFADIKCSKICLQSWGTRRLRLVQCTTDYFWVVVCKNHRFHHKTNTGYEHRILLGETDAFAALPMLPGENHRALRQLLQGVFVQTSEGASRRSASARKLSSASAIYELELAAVCKNTMHINGTFRFRNLRTFCQPPARTPNRNSSHVRSIPELQTCQPVEPRY